jgi:hypothetical protein
MVRNRKTMAANSKTALPATDKPSKPLRGRCVAVSYLASIRAISLQRAVAIEERDPALAGLGLRWAALAIGFLAFCSFPLTGPAKPRSLARRRQRQFRDR